MRFTIFFKAAAAFATSQGFFFQTKAASVSATSATSQFFGASSEATESLLHRRAQYIWIVEVAVSLTASVIRVFSDKVFLSL